MLTPWETHHPGLVILASMGEPLGAGQYVWSLWLKYSLFSQVPGVGPEAPPPCCGYPVRANAFEGSQTSQVARLHHCLCSSPWSPPVLGGLHEPPLLLWKFLGFSLLRTSRGSLRLEVEGGG